MVEVQEQLLKGTVRDDTTVVTLHTATFVIKPPKYHLLNRPCHVSLNVIKRGIVKHKLDAVNFIEHIT